MSQDITQSQPIAAPDVLIAARVAEQIRSTITKAIIAIAVPALVAIGGAGVATYVGMQVLTERADQAQREREQMTDRLTGIEHDLDVALDLRGELAALKASSDAQLRSIDRRLERIEGSGR